VHVAPGNYEESVLLSEFGDTSNPIKIVGETETGGELPVLDGGRSLTYGIAIIGEDEQHKSGGFVIENLAFRNYTDAGILAVLSDNIAIRNCLITDNGFDAVNPENRGEGFGADLVEINGLLVAGVEATRNGPAQDVWQGGVLGNDIAVWGSTDVEVSDSYMHDSIGGGLLIEDSVNALVENNRMNDSQLDANGEYWDGAIWLDGGHDVIVRNNTIDNNHGPGIVLSDEGVQQPYGYIIEDNTITNNLWGIYVWNFGVCPWPEQSIVHANNNIYSGNIDGDHWCTEWACGFEKPCD
jgi:parallel beta-helix repeat protein